MARMARLVVPGYPHHVVQRGSRRQRTFFCKQDYDTYVDLFCTRRETESVEVWAYCLMPNHVHFVLVPETAESLSRLVGKVHSSYARHVNKRHDWTGHLWQERFQSFAMDDNYTMAAVRYVELNPVRAGLCRRAADWRWSSARRHLFGIADRLMPHAPVGDWIADWSSFLQEDDTEDIDRSLRELTRSGCPGGNDRFVRDLEAVTGRRLRKRKPGPKRKVVGRSP